MSKPLHHLCQNCLGDGATPVEVGPTRGPQMDPYREQIELCAACKEALLAGDLSTFHSHYTDERTIRRNP